MSSGILIMENKDKTDKISLRETFLLHYRSSLLLNQHCPGIFTASAAEALCHSFTPYAGIYLSARIINELAGNRNPEVLWRLVLITVVITSLLALLNSLTTRWKDCKRGTFWHDKNKVYTDKMMEMDFASLDKQHTHDLRSQIAQNENWTGWGFTKVLYYFDAIIQSVLGIIGALALTVSLFALKVPASSSLACFNHPLFVIAMLGALLFTAFASPYCTYKADSHWINYADDSKLGNRLFFFYGYLSQDPHKALDMRMYQQYHICDYYFVNNPIFLPGSKIAKAAAGPMGALHALAAAISTAFTGVTYLFVCLKAWAGAFGIGSVTQYIGAITKLSQSFSSLLTTVGEMRNNAYFLRTTFEFLDIPNEMYQGSLTTEKRSDRSYEVEFKDVSFKYPNSETYALRHVSLKFKVGQRLAVVGMNGSGKTTFIKLLCRLYDPTEGEILLNGINIRKYRYDDYMSIFSVVFQDFQLLALPLGQNVAASKAYDKGKVAECLEKSGFAEKLTRMSEGIETPLYKDFSENGVDVSGGEAQKIAIARALYKDAPFIILDEPTAALDPIAEAEIYCKFNEIAGDKTAIYISHRLSSCRFCDDIAVFHEGQLIQQGSHEQLVADTEGKYYELWNAQAQYYQESNENKIPAVCT